VLCASLFGASHVAPTGPLGMLCFLGAAVYLTLLSDEQEWHGRLAHEC
jgi:hypothetical protein